MIPKLASYSSCTGCGACAASCTKDAIMMTYDKNGHLMPFVDERKCINCGTCEKKCPVVHPERVVRNNATNINTFTCWSTNKDLAENSTSGGVFAQIAEDAIQEKGASIYGAHLTDQNSCEHIKINATSDLFKITGTKYLQSNASYAYRNVKKDILQGKNCIFSGTPCQIAGLRSYLGNINTDNLLTIEVICHGCPSKVITDVATDFYQADHIVSYRDKKSGWHKGFSCTFAKKNGELITEPKGSSFFYKNFGGADRPSCYNCPYAKIQRVSDITLGDQWGLFDKYKDKCNSGANLVLCNTEKGKNVITRSNNLFFDLNENATLNAPTLFMPIETGASSLSRFLFIIKKCPPPLNTLLSRWIGERDFTYYHLQ